MEKMTDVEIEAEFSSALAETNSVLGPFGERVNEKAILRVRPHQARINYLGHIRSAVRRNRGSIRINAPAYAGYVEAESAYGLVERVARAEFGRSLKSDPVSTAVTFESSTPNQRARRKIREQLKTARGHAR